MIEGEAIILFGGRRIHAKLFHADVAAAGPMRLNRCLTLPAPNVEKIEAETACVGAMVTRVERGLGTDARRAERSPPLNGMVQAFSRAAAAGRSADVCVAEALRAAGEQAPVAPPAEQSIEQTFATMLEKAATARHEIAPNGSGDALIEPADLETIDKLVAVERAACADENGAREAARRLVGLAKAGGHVASNAVMPAATAAIVRNEANAVRQEVSALLSQSQDDRPVRRVSMRP